MQAPRPKAPGERTSPPAPPDAQAKQKLAIFVYEYLTHMGAKQAAKTFLGEIGWNKDVEVGEAPGFLHSWWCVFWDLYCAAPERRLAHEHSQEAKAFHDLGMLSMVNGLHVQGASPMGPPPPSLPGDMPCSSGASGNPPTLGMFAPGAAVRLMGAGGQHHHALAQHGMPARYAVPPGAPMGRMGPAPFGLMPGPPGGPGGCPPEMAQFRPTSFMSGAQRLPPTTGPGHTRPPPPGGPLGASSPLAAPLRGPGPPLRPQWAQQGVPPGMDAQHLSTSGAPVLSNGPSASGSGIPPSGCPPPVSSMRSEPDTRQGAPPGAQQCPVPSVSSVGDLGHERIGTGAKTPLGVPGPLERPPSNSATASGALSDVKSSPVGTPHPVVGNSAPGGAQVSQQSAAAVSGTGGTQSTASSTSTEQSEIAKIKASIMNEGKQFESDVGDEFY